MRRDPLALTVTFVAYVALSQAGSALPGFQPLANEVWVPGGAALAILLRFGRGLWPAVFAGALVAHLFSIGDPFATLIAAAADTAELWIAAALVDRLAGGTDVANDAGSILWLVIIASTTSLVSTTVGLAGLLFGGGAGPGATFELIGSWSRHVLGGLVVAPVVLVWASAPLETIHRRRLFEAAGLLLSVTLLGSMVFVGWLSADVSNYPLAFLTMPLLLWAGIRFGPREAATVIVLLAGLTAWGAQHGFGPFVAETERVSATLVQAFVGVMAVVGLTVAAIGTQRRDARTKLKALALTDPLTGLANHRRLLDVMRAEIERSRRTARPFALLFVDINGLQAINDRHGHLSGSRVIRRVAAALRKTCRATDVVARFGGDEFAVVLTETGGAGGQRVLERLSERLAANPETPAVSVCGGIAEFPRDGDSPTLLLRAADEALAVAKRATASTG